MNFKNGIEIFGLKNVPLVKKGDDISEIILESLKHSGLSLQDGDVIVIAQSIISRSNGRIRNLNEITPSEKALELFEIIDPKAEKTYQERLKYFDLDSRVPSSLDGRVICLPYKFEELLLYLKDEYLNQLRVGLSMVSRCTSSERIGSPVNWIDCLKPLIKAEHTEKVQDLINNKIPKSNLKDIIVDPKKLKGVKIIPVETIEQVLKEALVWKGKERILKKILAAR